MGLSVNLVETNMISFTNTPSEAARSNIVITNVRIFDGESEELREGMNVLVEKNVIKKIQAASLPCTQNDTVIDGKGHVLMPGMINSHFHMIGAMSAQMLFSNPTKDYRAFWLARGLQETLMQGITTIRDAGGNDWGVVRAAEEGMFNAPRIFASGALISQTSGHFDFRHTHIPPDSGQLSGGVTSLLDGISYIADGVDAVRKAARECLRQGAKQIKIASGGGIISKADPIHTLQYSAEEVRAAVEVAESWGTYVASHAYTAESAIRDIENGVMSIEHASIMNDHAVSLGVEKEVWWSPQTVVFLHPPEGWGEAERKKLAPVAEGLEKTFELFRQYNAKVLFGTDCFGNMDDQHLEFVYRSRFFPPFEILRHATSNGGKALRMCGKLYPYSGDLGVIREGAMADMLIVKNNPLEDATILSNYEEQLLLIMKDGCLYKNLLG